MDFEKSKEEFLKLFENIDENYKCRFARWVGGFCEGEIDKLPPTEIEETLNQIGDVLRQDIEAPGGKLKNEITNAPDEKEEILETDEFVYPDVVLNAMEYSLQACCDCSSRNIKDLELVSHSMSNDTLCAVFDEFKDFKCIVDVGSRTGCVLYAAYLMSSAEKIIGIEIESGWCKLQRKIVDQFQFEDKIEIMEEDVTKKPALKKIGLADFVVLHNPFEWFAKDKGACAYAKVCETLAPGAQVLSLPPIEDHGIDVSKWLENITPKTGPWKDELQDFALMEVSEAVLERRKVIAEQEAIDEKIWKQTAKDQLEEFYATRKKNLANLSSIERDANEKKSKEPVVVSMQNICDFIDFNKPDGQSNRTRMTQILLSMKK